MPLIRRHSGDVVRPPAVSGIFYPATADALAASVRGLLAAIAPPHRGPPPRALIAPHAGYRYSGPVAASAFAALGGALPPQRIVVLGPSHYVAFRGLALPEAKGFATPLGTLTVDDEAASALERLPQVRRLAAAHRREHAIEVELPFLQLLLPETRIVPLVVGEASAVEVAEVLAALDDGDDTLIVVSSDLSHYLPYDQARRRDQATAHRIESLHGGLDPSDACGCRAIDGLLVHARRHSLVGHCLDLRSSGDTAGDRARVVGYGAFAFGREAARD